MAIRSFKCADTEALFHMRRVARFAAIERPALRKLVQLDIAERLQDLRVPPGNRLESLAGDRLGQWSIRINDRYRICFLWMDGNAQEVEIVDYH
jgi:toxin HigB-1